MADNKAPEIKQPDAPVADVYQGARPNTDANVFIQLLVGALGTLAVAFAVLPCKGTKADYVWALINNRGPIQYIELFMAFMVAAQIFLKQRVVRRQMRLIYDNPIDLKINLNDESEVQSLRKAIMSHLAFTTSIVLSRMERILGMWLATKDQGRVSGWASAESGRDTSFSDQSFALSRVLIWAIPILGFIGTVQGLGSAVAGFADFLSGEAELSAIKGAIAQVTIGLGVAFDTTFLALMLVTGLMFPLTSLQRREESMFVEIDIFLDDALVSRLPAAEQQPIVIENLEDSIESAFRRYIPDPDRYDEVFTQSIERAATAVEEKFANLSKNYESSLRELTGNLAGSLSGVGGAMETAIRKVAGEIREQEQVLMTSRRSMAEQEREHLKGVLEDIHGVTQKVAAQYQQGAESLRVATEAGAAKSAQAAQELVRRMEEVSRLAAGIESLLKVQQSVEKGLAGITATDEFKQTLERIRSHLETTDEFCSRMSKPRVITLCEEVAG